MLEGRSTEVEYMDDLLCSGKVLIQTLHELEIINRLLGGNNVTIDGFNHLFSNDTGDTLRIADLGCGSGDMLKRIYKWAQRNKTKVELIGIDANPHVVNFARSNLGSFPSISVEEENILSPGFHTKKFDVITATLFFHHFTSQELVGLFQQLKKQAGKGIVVNDLHRHRFALYSIKILTRLFSRSPMVKFDAPLSVRRGFTKSELENILFEAGIERYSLKWKWAFRWQLVIPTGI